MFKLQGLKLANRNGPSRVNVGHTSQKGCTVVHWQNTISGYKCSTESNKPKMRKFRFHSLLFYYVVQALRV